MGRAALLAIVGLALSAPAAADSYVYAANLGGSSLSQYGMGPGGALSPKSPPSVQAQSFLAAAAVSPDGRSVYFADESNGYLLQYDVGAAGQLTPKPGTPQLFPSGVSEAMALAMSPGGGTLYVAGENIFTPDEVTWAGPRPSPFGSATAASTPPTT